MKKVGLKRVLLTLLGTCMVLGCQGVFAQSAQKQIKKQLPKEVGGQAQKMSLWSTKPYTPFGLLVGAQSYYYATPNELMGSSELESRLQMTFQKRFESEHLVLGADTSFWASWPRETSFWGHVRSLYVGYQNVKDATVEMALGRTMPDWGGIDNYSPIKSLFPQFWLDPYYVRSDGMIGFYGRLKEDFVDVEVLLSPFFLPNLGGPRFDYDETGKFQSVSRWALPLYYQATVGSAEVPLRYYLHYPQNIFSVLRRNSGAIRLSIKDFLEGYQLSGFLLNGVDPAPRLKILGRLDILDQKDFQGTVDIYPEFYRHTAYGFEFRLDRPTFRLNMESVYRIPENNISLEPFMWRAQEWKNLISIQTKHQKPIWPEVLMGLASAVQFNAYQDPYFKIPDPSLTHFFGELAWKLHKNVQLTQGAEVSVDFDEALMRHALSVTLTQQMNLRAGVDLMTGKDDTYWGYFRDQDRLWMGVQYAF
ncbi:MAG: hypothetical protein HY390_02030 [Deltaproteobacteria bacterium]|nr:hypothetical protein [Deltaproteobacteria bacterium]